MKNFLVLTIILPLTILFSGCSNTEDEQMINQLRISNEIIYDRLEEKRSGFLSFLAEYPDSKEYVRLARHLIYLYDNDPNKFHNIRKYDASIQWLKDVVHKDSLWEYDAKFQIPDSSLTVQMHPEMKKNIVLTNYAKLFKDTGQIGIANIRCDFSPFAAFHLDSTDIVLVKGMTPFQNNDYEISIDEPLAEVVPVRMLGLIYLPKKKKEQYEIIITTKDPMYKSPRIDSLRVNLK